MYPSLVPFAAATLGAASPLSDTSLDRCGPEKEKETCHQQQPRITYTMRRVSNTRRMKIRIGTIFHHSSLIDHGLRSLVPPFRQAGSQTLAHVFPAYRTSPNLGSTG